MLPPFVTWVELEFPKVAAQVCDHVPEEEHIKEEGDPPDAHQHLDPLPYDYNLSVKDRMDRFVIRHNFH